MTALDDVPADVVDAIRSACLALPETYEERAWAGTRWRIRAKTFAHVLLIDHGWPPAYARAVGSDGPIVVLTFRTADPEFYELAPRGEPFFYPGWFRDLAGVAVGPATDWAEVSELVTESYCLLAPKKLATTVDHSTS